MTQVVLVHGAFHGGWCWTRVVAVLAARGIESVVVELPLTGSQDDVDAVVSALDRIDGDAVVCAHSYGGQVVSTALSGRTDVSHLIYLTAFMLDRGETVSGTMASDPSRMVDAMVVAPDGLRIDPAKAADIFCNATNSVLAQQAVDHLRPVAPTAEDWPDVEPAWRTIPSTYVTCSLDNAILPSLQERMAPRAGRTVNLDSDHSPYLEHADEVADLITSLIS